MKLKQSPNEPAIVLLHGFPFDRSMWREQIDFLSANGFRAIAPDLRGLGENRFNGEIATMDDMARDVAALMDELRIDQAVICGLSMGCYVAFEFVRLFPARVRALVLAGARAQGADEAERKSREDKAQDVLSDGMGPVVEAMLSDLLAPKTLAEKPAVVARVREMILGTDPRGAAAAQRGMAARRDYSGDLSDVNVPTLIIAGREDVIRKPDDAELVHRGITKSVLEVIDDAGHLMNMERPEIFNEVLTDFLGLIH
ncbi:MAG TPA: alpha/beta fold hydrolase [Pyrinomonadaceae bacterium]|nr:alpha/beta fold hydrolase [Pyrinomonadaceae bacterium]